MKHFAALLAVALAHPACASPFASAAHDRARPAQAQAAASLQGAVQAAIAASGLKNATIAISIREVGSGASVVDIDAARLMTPASNMKVLTTAAALRILGPDFAYATRMVRTGDRLTVIGDGDPSLGDPEMANDNVAVDETGARRPGLTPEGLVDTWVAAARRAGITQVRELVVDDRIFDREFQHPRWPNDQLSNSYCAEIAGLNFHVGLVQAKVTAAGGRPRLSEWTPSAPWLELDISKASVAKNGKQGAALAQTTDPARFELRGNVKSTGTETVGACVHDMPAFFGRFVTERLRVQGIQVGAVRLADARDPTPTGTAIGSPITTSLPKVVQHCNVESQNLYAESLLKRIGAMRSGGPGSWATGAAALAGEVDAVLGAGTAARSLKVSDGSGLCRDNLVAPALFSAWMRAIALDPKVGPAFIDSLAVAGVSGTVKKRFNGLDVQHVFVPCKTGYINGVSCLSGYVGRPGQTPRYAFSVMCNGLSEEKEGVRKAKALQEQVVKLLAATL